MAKIGRDKNVMSPRARLLSFAAVLGLAFAGVAEASVAPRLIETPPPRRATPWPCSIQATAVGARWIAASPRCWPRTACRCWASTRCATSWTRRSPSPWPTTWPNELRRHQAKWDRRKIVLIGYSFGADALPAIVPLLPADLRAQIKGVVLIGTGPARRPDVPPRQLAEPSTADSFAVAPAVEALKGLPMTCIYGDKERLDICPTLPATTIRQVKLHGGHHFDGDYGDWARRSTKAVAL
jgi:hypothetical protein